MRTALLLLRARALGGRGGALALAVGRRLACALRRRRAPPRGLRGSARASR